MAKSQKKSTPVKKARKKSPRRRKKANSSDAIRAVILTGILIAVSALISIAIIVIHSAAKSPETVLPPDVTAVTAPAAKPVTVPAPAKPPEKPSSVPAPSKAPAEPSSVPVAAPRREPPRQDVPKRTGTVVFVIDDAGNNLRELEPFLRFPGPLTIAVLPGLPNSAEAARRIRSAGKEVFLHQPMEAIGGQNPGPGAIYTGMGPAEIRSVLERNIAEIGPIAGMNNHQGSKITMDREMMETVLAFCRENRLYFLDSRTTADTAAPAAAERLGIKIGERDVFIDNIQEKASMIRYVQDGLTKAEKKGSAVMIGHTWSTELAATLEELYPDLIAQGFSLTTVSRLMTGAINSPWDDGF
ncbi:MAG: divergent polysaccharide deacetylase family protein [Treponema sp.]|nr:divergent polysaccharide deacetylase family protein [Treponema sp.]